MQTMKAKKQATENIQPQYKVLSHHLLMYVFQPDNHVNAFSRFGLQLAKCIGHWLFKMSPIRLFKSIHDCSWIKVKDDHLIEYDIFNIPSSAHPFLRLQCDHRL